MKCLLLLALVLLCVACQAPAVECESVAINTNNITPTVRMVTISDAFKADEIESILAAIDDWNAAIPTLNYHAIIVPAEDARVVRSTAVFEGKSMLMGEVTLNADGVRRMTLYVEMLRKPEVIEMGATLQDVTRHELGHWFGAEHDPDLYSGCAMSYEMPLKICQSDIDAVCAKRPGWCS